MTSTELEVFDAEVIPPSTVDSVFDRHREFLFNLMDAEKDPYTLIAVLGALAKGVTTRDAILYLYRL